MWVGLVGWMIGSVEGGKLVLEQSLKIRAEAAPPGKSAKAHSGEPTGLALQARGVERAFAVLLETLGTLLELVEVGADILRLVLGGGEEGGDIAQVGAEPVALGAKVLKLVPSGGKLALGLG